MTTMSQTKKLQKIAFRAAMQTSRNVWAVSELARWLNSDADHVKRLVSCLVSRNRLDAKIEGQSIRFAPQLVA